eukprot:gnl/TRDRNA2_/TRDRNA2_189281_c0_seq1.p1 gnl/TRDRNA2_/TRDRNA2_189281_c0~~gnl/TRDRNA2_/TRDRNA2_189281_c0_seq1.p1  ORF type:complete len:530 (+),score=119.09 gnl/TRDRNA2_/TRDRNA2_189281_c0_seq1:55-1644(+)
MQTPPLPGPPPPGSMMPPPGGSMMPPPPGSMMPPPQGSMMPASLGPSMPQGPPPPGGTMPPPQSSMMPASIGPSMPPGPPLPPGSIVRTVVHEPVPVDMRPASMAAGGYDQPPSMAENRPPVLAPAGPIREIYTSIDEDRRPLMPGYYPPGDDILRAGDQQDDKKKKADDDEDDKVSQETACSSDDIFDLESEIPWRPKRKKKDKANDEDEDPDVKYEGESREDLIHRLQMVEHEISELLPRVRQLHAERHAMHAHFLERVDELDAKIQRAHVVPLGEPPAKIKKFVGKVKRGQHHHLKAEIEADKIAKLPPPVDPTIPPGGKVVGFRKLEGLELKEAFDEMAKTDKVFKKMIHEEELEERALERMGPYGEGRVVDSNALLVPSEELTVGPLTAAGLMGGIYPMSAPPSHPRNFVNLDSMRKETYERSWRRRFHWYKSRMFQELYFRPWLEKDDVDIQYANKFEARFIEPPDDDGSDDDRTFPQQVVDKALAITFPDGYSSSSSDEEEEEQWYEYFRKTWAYRNREAFK